MESVYTVSPFRFSKERLVNWATETKEIAQKSKNNSSFNGFVA